MSFFFLFLHNAKNNIYGTYENYHNDDQNAVESVCHRVFSEVSISSSSLVSAGIYS